MEKLNNFSNNDKNIFTDIIKGDNGRYHLVSKGNIWLAPSDDGYYFSSPYIAQWQLYLHRYAHYMNRECLTILITGAIYTAMDLYTSVTGFDKPLTDSDRKLVKQFVDTEVEYWLQYSKYDKLENVKCKEPKVFEFLNEDYLHKGELMLRVIVDGQDITLAHPSKTVNIKGGAILFITYRFIFPLIIYYFYDDYELCTLEDAFSGDDDSIYRKLVKYCRSLYDKLLV